MEPQTDYKGFMKMDKEKQIEFVQNAAHDAASPLPPLEKFPDEDFVNLRGVQDKKPIRLATYRYPAPETKAVVIFWHGLGSHGGVAANFGEAFSKQGITLVGYDQRGHGRSEGERGYLDSSKDMLNDAKTFLTEVSKLYPNIPLFLMGQSLGSLLALVIAREFKEFKFSGLLLATPSMKKPSHNKMISAVSDFALKLMPKKAGIFELRFDNSCRNPTAIEMMKNDPLVYRGKVYAGTLGQIISLMEMVPEKSWDKACEYPVAIIQGGLDKLVDPAMVIDFFEKLKVKDKQFWWFPKMWNNFFTEAEAPQILQMIEKWVQERI